MRHILPLKVFEGGLSDQLQGLECWTDRSIPEIKDNYCAVKEIRREDTYEYRWRYTLLTEVGKLKEAFWRSPEEIKMM